MEDADADDHLAELTAEMAWLQRLARALLHGDDGGDLAQDTWLVAHDRAPGDGRPLRPWLARVAVNLVRMQARSRRRRDARERATESLVESVPTPDRLVERVELQRHVAGEVLTLREPYRSTVLLHYFEDLSCAEIARRLAIPEATVRGRLKVALDKLRERFGPHKSRARLLAPLAGIHTAAHETANLAMGVIAMKKVAASIVVVILLVLAVVWRKQRTDDPVDGGVTARGDRVALAPVGVQLAEASNIPAWMTQAELPARRVAGRVEYAGAPVADATVRLALETSPGVLLPVAESRSDAAGTFDFGAQPAAMFTVSAEAPRRAPAAVTVSVADPSARPDALVLLLGDCNLRLEGRVLDASGGPIVKARLVAAGLGGVETDARGTYTLCLRTTRPQVRIEADGYGALEMPLILNGPLHQDFRLAPEGVIAGRVVTDSNEPVPGARVIVNPDPIERAQHLSSGWAIADAGGMFRVSRLAPGRYRLQAAAEELASVAPVDAVVHAGSSELDTIIRVTRTARVRGRVIMAGAPIAGARVSAARNGEPVGAASYTQPDGSFALAGVPRGRTSFVAWPYDVTAPASLDVDGAQVDGVVVEIARRAAIRGRVMRRGAPVAGAEVFVPRVLFVHADSGGNYVLDGLAPGQVQISAGHSGIKAFANKTVPLRAGEDKTVDIELDLAGAASGIVVDDQGRPIPGVHVRMQRDDNNDFGESTTDADGRFDCFNLAGGEYGIGVFPSPGAARPFASASGERFPPAHVPHDGAATGITLAIKNERLTIRGIVVDDAGAPVADAFVDAVTHGRNFGLPSTMTDASGHFTIDNLAPGDYAILAHAADGSEGIARRIAGGTSDVEVVLVRAGGIEGTLAGFSSPPSVELALLSTNVRIATTALVDGARFWHRGLRPGRYAVQARANGEIDSAEIEVRPGEVARVALQNRRTGRIEGHVVEFGTKQPIAGMRCEAKLSLAGPSSDPAMQGVSDATGHFAMRAPVGKVHVLCAPPDQSLSITGDDVEVMGDATANLAVTAVRASFGSARGDAGFSLTPMTLPLQLARVRAGGGAAAQGARDGDQLVAVDGAPVNGMLPLTAMFLVWNHRPGTTMTIDVLRAGSPMTFKVPIVAE